MTFDDDDRELTDTDVLIDDGRITAVEPMIEAPRGAREIDGRELIVLPGLINAHQHLYQVGLRSITELERALIGPWLGGLGERCRRWDADGRLTPELVGALAACGLAESLLGGVTTVADQHYLHTAGPTRPHIEATIEAATRLGVRIHAGRGTLTLGRDQGGTAHPDLVQEVGEVLRHTIDLIDRHHDAAEGSMCRIDLAPCGVHVDLPELFDEFAALAEDREGVRLHTHLYEHVDSDFCRDTYGMSPWEFLVEHGWAQPRTWVAHVVDVPLAELPAVAAAGVGVAHLPAPDLRMGWGTAPVRDMWDAGVTVGFGTTGSASNDGANMLGDLRLAALAHRSSSPDPSRWPTARELLRAATRGSADCLGRTELGRVAVGAAADVAAWDLGTVDRVGVDDPVIGLLLAGLSDRAHWVIANGRVVVDHGRLVTADERDLARRANSLLTD